jgi:hypothetical protein
MLLPLGYARGAQENLWPKSSLERPVARHFVCYVDMHMSCRSVSCSKYKRRLSEVCRNCSGRGKIYFSAGIHREPPNPEC